MNNSYTKKQWTEEKQRRYLYSPLVSDGMCQSLQTVNSTTFQYNFCSVISALNASSASTPLDTNIYSICAFGAPLHRAQKKKDAGAMMSWEVFVHLREQPEKIIIFHMSKTKWRTHHSSWQTSWGRCKSPVLLWDIVTRTAPWTWSSSGWCLCCMDPGKRRTCGQHNNKLNSICSRF